MYETKKRSDARVEDVRFERRVSASQWELDESTEQFDRIAFAMQLLALLHPARMTVAVYERYEELRVERGRDLPCGSTWAMVGIPPYASRQHIALALAELAGVARVPFVVDLLASMPSSGQG